ncbi:trypsin-like peptidase domain-containing protein [Thermomicrobium sp.]
MRRTSQRTNRARRGAALSAQLLLVLLVLVTACRSLPFRDQSTPTPTAPRASDQPLSWTEVEERLRPATVLVEFTLGDQSPFPTTGVAYAPGLILTVAPPIADQPPTQVRVRPPDRSESEPAELLGLSTCDGLAVVRVASPHRLPLAPLAIDRTPDIGEDVLVFGYPASDPTKPAISLPAAATGTATDSDRERDELGVNIALGDLTLGALMADRYGAVLGLALPAGSFLPAATALQIAQSLAEGRGVLWLGIQLSTHRNAVLFGTATGLVVRGVTPGGPAATAGVEPGMLLTRLADREVANFGQVCATLRQYRQGDELAVELRQPRTAEVTILTTIIRVGEPSQRTPTVIRVEPRPAKGQPLTYRWTFEETTPDDWPLGRSDLGSGEIADGAYAVTLTQPQAFGILEPRTIPPGTDQRVRTRVTVPDEAAVGLLVRSSIEPDQSRSFYVCIVVRSGGQLVALCSLALAGEPFVLLPATPLATSLPPDEPIELELAARDSSLTFRVAGETIAELEDPLLGSGTIGLWVESFDTVPVTIRFDEVEVELVPASGKTRAQTTG